MGNPPPRKPERPPVIRYDEEEVTAVLRGDLADPFAAALHAAARTPEQSETWDHLEALAKSSGKTDDAAGVYRAVLERPYPLEVARKIAERAIAFHDDWVSDEAATVQLLSRIVEIDASLDWAFSRLSLLYTVAQRWEELLSLYDRALVATTDAGRRVGLLTEAAHVAKDCAGQPERAIRYLEQLFAARPADAQVAASLERLLKQQHRYRELIDLWNARLPLLPADEASSLRARIATAWLSHLHDPAGALAAAEPLLSDPGSAPAACQLLARVVASPTADAEVRRRALGLLRERLDADGRGADLVRSLEVMLSFVDGAKGPSEGVAERVALHAEIAKRLLASGDEESARDHLAALVVLDPPTWDDAAVDALLGGGARLAGGFSITQGAESGRALLHQAAALAAGELASPARAAVLYRKLLATDADDRAAIEALSVLYASSGEQGELLALRRHELSRETDGERRLSLRLAIAALLGEAGQPDAQIAALQESLAERRGHRETVDALAAVLTLQGRHAELEAALAREAEAVEEAGDDRAAARLWAEAARVAESPVGDVPRAIQALSRAAALAEDPAVLDALARLEAGRGERTRVVDWLERRLAIARPDERVDVTLRLGPALIATGQRARAREVLQAAFDEAPGRTDVLTLLARLLREAGDFVELSAALMIGIEHAKDPETEVRLRREAAEVLHRDLGDPMRASTLLRPALALAPEDAVLRGAMADVLRAGGHLDEAAELLTELIAAFGKRRARERAELSFQLARVRAAQGRGDEARAELETAAAIDVAHAGVQRMLGELCRELGQLERADRAYNALLLLVSRARSAGAPLAEAGLAETLFELHRLAELRGASGRAAENLESAFEIASESDYEARRLEAAMREAGAGAVLVRALEARLGRTTDPRDRAAIFAEIGRTLDEGGQPSAGLNALLSALGEAPGEASLHTAASQLAQRAGLVAKYETRVRQLSERALESGDSRLASMLLVRLALSREAEGALDEAAVLLSRAEDTGEHLPIVWRAIARVASARGDGAAALVALRKLDSGELSDEERAPTRHALARLELSSDATRDAGLETLERAVAAGLSEGAARAALREAADADPASTRVVSALVSHARRGAPPGDLLDALTRAASQPGATQELLAEAAELAAKLGDPRETSLLLRAVEVERSLGADLGSALWALRRLVLLARARGDLAAAVAYLRDVERAALPEESRAAALTAAELLAGPIGDLGAAADTYERLRELDPGDASVWGPLLDVVRRLDDVVRLDRLLAATIEAAYDARERNPLRMERARLLLADPSRQGEVIAVLFAVLEEEPDHAVAPPLLADLLEAAGRTEELADLLARQLDGARDRGDRDAVVALSLRLGGVLRPVRNDEAVVVLKAALRVAPSDATVLRALVDALPADDPERGDRMESLLALVTGDEAVALALALADLRTTAGDAPGAERALEAALAARPEDATVRARVGSLADELARAAGLGEGGRETLAAEGPVPLIRRAARLYTRLGEPARAASVLEQAVALAPADLDTVLALVRAHLDAGADTAALAAVERAPEATGPQRVPLHRLAAEAHARGRRYDAGLAALDAARSAGDATADAAIVAMLRDATLSARVRGEAEAEAAYARRLAGLLCAAGDAAGALPHLTRLVGLVSGDDRVTAVTALHDTLASLGRADEAREALAQVVAESPAAAGPRKLLRALYAQAGAHRELSGLLSVEARYAPDDAARFDVLCELGRLRLLTLGEPSTAVGPLLDARALRPTDHEVTVLLADAYAGASLVDDATELLTEAMQRHGNRRSRELSALQQRMASLASAVGDREAQLAWLGAALETHPQNGEVAAALAEAAAAAGDAEAATKALRAITLLKGPCPMSRATAYARLAALARDQGDARKAVFLAKKATAEEPAHAEASALLAELG